MKIIACIFLGLVASCNGGHSRISPKVIEVFSDFDCMGYGPGNFRKISFVGRDAPCMDQSFQRTIVFLVVRTARFRCTLLERQQLNLEVRINVRS